jgi:hypothetical protein
MGNDQVDKLVDCAVRGAAMGGGECLSVISVGDDALVMLTLCAVRCLLAHLTV